MSESHYSNAMTEIALALAMAFFSIMVLTMLSVGAEFQPSPAAASAPDAAARLDLAPSAPSTAAASSEETLVIHYRGRFLDAQLAAGDPQTLAASGAIVLAIDPALAIAEAVAICEQIPTTDLVVTTLDARPSRSSPPAPRSPRWSSPPRPRTGRPRPISRGPRSNGW